MKPTQHSSSTRYLLLRSYVRLISLRILEWLLRTFTKVRSLSTYLSIPWVELGCHSGLSTFGGLIPLLWRLIRGFSQSSSRRLNSISLLGRKKELANSKSCFSAGVVKFEVINDICTLLWRAVVPGYPMAQVDSLCPLILKAQSSQWESTQQLIIR